MIQPDSYTTRIPNSVLARQFVGSDAEMQGIADWARSLLPEDAIVVANQMDSGSMFIQNGSFSLIVPNGNYLYLDEDGFHTVSPGAFEMQYKKDAPTP